MPVQEHHGRSGTTYPNSKDRVAHVEAIEREPVEHGFDPDDLQ
jgi:hypothetical protein